MANGDEAAADDLPIVPGTAPRSLGYDEINLTRDLLSRRVPKTDVAPAGTYVGNKIARYSAAGRLQSLYPAVPEDVATAGYVLDAINGFPLATQPIILELLARVAALEKKPK